MAASATSAAPATTGPAVDAVDRRHPLTTHYARGAAAYDRLWAPVIATIGRRLLQQLPLATARLVVDLGTGTGHLLPDLRQSAPEAQVVGVDLTLGMLRQVAPPPRTAVAAMDARRLGLRPGDADVVVAPFVLFHLADPMQGLAEVSRVLRPDGWFGMVTWGVRRPPRAQDQAVALLDHEGVPPDARTNDDSHHLLDTPAKVLELLAAAGFTAARSWVEPLDHHWEPERLAASLTERGPCSRRLARLEPAHRDAVTIRVCDLIGSAPTRDLLDASEAVLAVARRPG